MASQGTLKTPAVLAQQVRRMLADPKAHALVENFAGQWLHLRNLKNKVPNSNEFPDFDDNLRQAMLTETELFVGAIIHEDRNVLDLMTADDTFVNERLSRSTTAFRTSTAAISGASRCRRRAHGDCSARARS